MPLPLHETALPTLPDLTSLISSSRAGVVDVALSTSRGTHPTIVIFPAHLTLRGACCAVAGLHNETSNYYYRLIRAVTSRRRHRHRAFIRIPGRAPIYLPTPSIYAPGYLHITPCRLPPQLHQSARTCPSPTQNQRYLEPLCHYFHLRRRPQRRPHLPVHLPHPRRRSVLH